MKGRRGRPGKIWPSEDSEWGVCVCVEGVHGESENPKDIQTSELGKKKY